MAVFSIFYTYLTTKSSFLSIPPVMSVHRACTGERLSRSLHAWDVLREFTVFSVQEREQITLAMDIAYEFKNLRSLVQFAY